MFLRFFDKVEVANFEVASDAFSTFKVRERSNGSRSRAAKRWVWGREGWGFGELGIEMMVLARRKRSALWHHPCPAPVLRAGRLQLVGACRGRGRLVMEAWRPCDRMAMGCPMGWTAGGGLWWA